VNLEFLASAKFGWIFIWSQIVLIYLAFIWFHKLVEKRNKAK